MSLSPINSPVHVFQCSNDYRLPRPTTAGQSELSPAQAAELWMQYMEPLKQANNSIRLGSPAMANGPAGIPWMQQFMGNCSSCSVDFTVVRKSHLNWLMMMRTPSYLRLRRLLLHQCDRLHQLPSELSQTTPLISLSQSTHTPNTLHFNRQATTKLSRNHFGSQSGLV